MNIKIIYTGKSILEKINSLIKNAKKSIFISAHVIYKDTLTNNLLELLMEKANSGIKIVFIKNSNIDKNYNYFLEDIYDIEKFNINLFHFLNHPNIKVELLKEYSFIDYIIVDNEEALLGSIILSDNYHLEKDFSLYFKSKNEEINLLYLFKNNNSIINIFNNSIEDKFYEIIENEIKNCILVYSKEKYRKVKNINILSNSFLTIILKEEYLLIGAFSLQKKYKKYRKFLYKVSNDDENYAYIRNLIIND